MSDPGPYQNTEAWALAADRADPLSTMREEFVFPRDRDGAPLVYLCGNSLGLMPKAVPALLEEELDEWGRLGVEAHLQSRRPWFSYHEQFRETGARLVGARPGEVVMMNSLTVNLHLMLVSFYRPAGRRHKIVIERAAFPSDTYAVATHLATRGYDPAEALIQLAPDPGRATIATESVERLLAERGDEIALVLLPGVQYYTGQLFDIPRITAAAQRAGAVAGFDLAHAAGNVPLALHDWGVDFAAWCSYKYLNAGSGAIAGCFVHERHGKDLAIPRYAGWWGNDPATRFRLHLNESFLPREGADGWQISNPPLLSMTPLLASIEQFDRVGMAALRAKSLRLTGYLEYLIDQLGGGRIEQITPRDPAARGAQLSLLVRDGARALFDRLRAGHVLGDFRQPDVIRLSPAPIYNSFHDVWQAGRALAEALR
ncbi:MAG: kynureninase [Gemmatimonadetes bacterium]|nr:kynureninase [Gemmatimonadota bacterium]